MKIEDHIQNFIKSVIEREISLFCSLLSPLDISQLRKELYTNNKCTHIETYLKNYYLDTFATMICNIYTYRYYKKKQKYIVTYYFPMDNPPLTVEFSYIQKHDGTEIINLDLSKINPQKRTKDIS
ncbi:hypothetical protein [Staphylococcus gallinarum]|uniref:hypothetical protein n=1 Tax=Staphylococcus gallinarum TaxID=1293 RepID=UPI001E3034A3|nr:hypothetical protein [Staphylococcus gallinarum]MCD8787425.1 hypothetical protein [Staphylococcus gallinarum]MCD8845231.1 hypothetical protein [Staphylococcus gallinarum]